MFNSLLARCLSSMALEEIVNDRQVETVFSDDPVLAGAGGACVFIYTKRNQFRCRLYLDEVRENPEHAKVTNNPSLVKEVNEILRLPTDIHLMLFSKQLRDQMTPAEFRCIVDHERGHVFHRHLEKKSDGTYEQFITQEREADDHALKSSDPETMMSALEKCLRFGTEQAALWESGTSNSFIRKLFDSDIVDAITFKKMYLMSKMLHRRRFKELERLKKAKK